MSFRRNGAKPLVWKQWVSRNRDELTAVGVPAEIFADERRWWHFLEEGGLDWDTGWRVEMLTPHQAEQLQRLIVREFGAEGYECGLRALHMVRFAELYQRDAEMNADPNTGLTWEQIVTSIRVSDDRPL